MVYSIMKEEDRKALIAWHHWLDENRGDRAMLRRANGPDDVLLTPAFAHFLKFMPAQWMEGNRERLTDAAFVAAAVAHVKQNDVANRSFARALATPGKESGSNAAMSELRFQQLQKSRTPEDFFRRINRAVALLGGKANVGSLAEDILLWLRESRYGPAGKPQDRLAVRWATDYYHQLRD